MPRSRNERKCPAATPRGGELLSPRCWPQSQESYACPIFVSHCGLTAEVNQSRGLSHTRPRRTARPILLGCSMTPPTELKAPWAISVLMLSRQTLVPDSTDAISASMPRSRNERKCPAATPRGGELLLLRCWLLIPKEFACPIFVVTAG